MAGKISSFPSGVQGGPSRATAAITTNTRVQTTRGHVGLVTDVLTFPSGSGVWVLGNQRILVNGIPTVGATAMGIYAPASGEPPSTMTVVEADPKTDAI